LDVTVPPAWAAEWIECVLSDLGTSALLVGLTDDSTGETITELLMDGTLPVASVQQGSYDLLAAAAPYKWWKTARLLALSARDDIAGHLTLAGLDPWRLTVAQWTAAVYALCTKGADAKAQFKFDAPLDAPPPGVVDDAWMSEDDFAAMVTQARNMPGQK
jgi:hypothetical protein